MNFKNMKIGESVVIAGHSNKEVGQNIKSLVEKMGHELKELEYQSNRLIKDSEDMGIVVEAYNSMKRPLLDLDRLLKDIRKERGINP